MLGYNLTTTGAMIVNNFLPGSMGSARSHVQWERYIGIYAMEIKHRRDNKGIMRVQWNIDR